MGFLKVFCVFFGSSFFVPTLVAGLGAVPRPTKPTGAGGAGQRACPPQDIHR